MKTKSSGHREQGFSLLELLTVVAIIGIMAAIAIPNLGNINSASQAAVNRRNAQSIVNTYHSGLAMGIAWSGTDRNSKIDAVIAGQTAPSGIFAGQKAKAQGITGDLLAGVYPYIGANSSGDLLYDTTGGQSPN